MVKQAFVNERNKSVKTIILGRMVLHKRKNKRRPYILVEWSFAKERINERGSHMLVE